MFNNVTFECTALKNTNKVGLLKPDDQGYYRVVLGALNTYNSAGEYYEYEGAKELFQNSSSLMRRISNQALTGENGHPKREPGMSDDDYARRIMQIYENRVCVHIKQVDLVFDKYRDEQGRRIIGIEGLVIPSGELGYVLENDLKNPNRNIAFSIRSFTENIPTFTGVKKILRNIVCWDFVGEMGISLANKFHSPALESLGETKFSRTQLEHAYFNHANTGLSQSVSQESVRLNAQELFHSLGWVDSKSSNPSYLRW